MPQLLMMPDLPPEANDWKQQFCRRWEKLLEAQEELLHAQLKVIGVQREMIRELLAHKE